MKVYQEITLLPRPEEDVPIHYLWSRVYQQIHLALVEQKGADDLVKAGVSFPDYNSDFGKPYLGCKLRLFAASSGELEVLNLSHWLERLTDYIHITSIRNVPLDKVAGYACFKRIHIKGSAEKLARRRAKKLDVSYDEALSFFQDQSRPLSEKKTESYPFIRMQSLSNEHQYYVTVQKADMTEEIFKEGFSTYGLSSKENPSTVPLF